MSKVESALTSAGQQSTFSYMNMLYCSGRHSEALCARSLNGLIVGSLAFTQHSLKGLQGASKTKILCASHDVIHK